VSDLTGFNALGLRADLVRHLKNPLFIVRMIN